MQTGNIFGKTQAKDGSVLPGVTVTLTGPGAPQTFVTDATGSFRFVNARVTRASPDSSKSDRRRSRIGS